MSKFINPEVSTTPRTANKIKNCLNKNYGIDSENCSCRFYGLSGIIPPPGNSAIQEITLPINCVAPTHEPVIDTGGNVNIYGIGKFTGNDNTEWQTLMGVAVYDSTNTVENVLGVIQNGEEIELEDPKEFWQNYNQQEQFIAIKRSNAVERKRYLHFRKRPAPSDGEDLKVKIVLKNGYELDKTIIANDTGQGFEPLDYDTLLGISAAQVAESRMHYDLALLFDNVDFLNPPANEPNPLGGNKYFLKIDNISNNNSVLTLLRDLYTAVQDAFRKLAEGSLLSRDIVRRARKSIFKHSNENLSCMTKNETPKQSFCQNFAVLELLCTIKMTISSKKRHKTRSNGYFKLKLVVGKYETGEN